MRLLVFLILSLNTYSASFSAETRCSDLGFADSLFSIKDIDPSTQLENKHFESLTISNIVEIDTEYRKSGSIPLNLVIPVIQRAYSYPNQNLLPSIQGTISQWKLKNILKEYQANREPKDGNLNISGSKISPVNLNLLIFNNLFFKTKYIPYDNYQWHGSRLFAMSFDVNIYPTVSSLHPETILFLLAKNIGTAEVASTAKAYDGAWGEPSDIFVHDGEHYEAILERSMSAQVSSEEGIWNTEAKTKYFYSVWKNIINKDGISKRKRELMIMVLFYIHFEEGFPMDKSNALAYLKKDINEKKYVGPEFSNSSKFNLMLSRLNNKKDIGTASIKASPVTKSELEQARIELVRSLGTLL